MSGQEFSCFHYWWVFPLAMIVLCLLMMRFRRGSGLCGCYSWRRSASGISESDSAEEILDKRYAIGELDDREYEAKRSVLHRLPNA